MFIAKFVFLLIFFLNLPFPHQDLIINLTFQTYLAINLFRLPTWPKGAPGIFARQQIRGSEERVASVAQIMMDEGEVQDWRPNFQSGMQSQ
jgi:hypothetical protein